MHSGLFLDFLAGNQEYECKPWGMPARNIFGWQKPCYLLQEGYAESFKELLETTEWKDYGVASGNPKCANCMVSCGYETPAVIEGFTTLKGFIAMARGNFNSYPNAQAMKVYEEGLARESAPLVQIEKHESEMAVR
jgi:hypothetical protein